MISDTFSYPHLAKVDAELLNLLSSSGERMKKQHRPLFRGDTRVVSVLMGASGAQSSDSITPPNRLNSLPSQAHAMLENLCELLENIDTKLHTIQTEMYALQHTAMEANEVASIGLENNQKNNPFLARIDQMIRQHMIHHPTDTILDDAQSMLLRARKDASTISYLLSQYKILNNNITDFENSSIAPEDK